jgi:hypothetical protein
MMNPPRISLPGRRRAHVSFTGLIALIIWLAQTLPTSSATFTWKGAGATPDFVNADNWTGGVAPTTASNDYIFSGSRNTAPSLGNYTWNAASLTFAADAGAFTLAGAPTLSLSSHRFYMNVGSAITQNSAHAQLVAPTLYMGNANTRTSITGTGGGSLTVGSLRFGAAGSNINTMAVSRDVTIGLMTRSNSATGTLDLVIDAGRTATITGPIAGNDQASATTFTLAKKGTGTLVLAGPNLNNAAGQTILYTGALVVDHSQALGNGWVNITGGTLTLNTELAGVAGFSLSGNATLETNLSRRIILNQGALTLADGASFMLPDLRGNTFQLSDLFSGYDPAMLSVGMYFAVNGMATTYADGVFTIRPEGVGGIEALQPQNEAAGLKRARALLLGSGLPGEATDAIQRVLGGTAMLSRLTGARPSSPGEWAVRLPRWLGDKKWDVIYWDTRGQDSRSAEAWEPALAVLWESAPVVVWEGEGALPAQPQPGTGTFLLAAEAATPAPVTRTGGAPGTSIYEIRKLFLSPNPGGLQVGFWANYNNSGKILTDFGMRPFERVSFHKWNLIEKSPGIYDWGTGRGIFYSEKYAHLAGSSIITNVNTFFTKNLNPSGMDTIPAFYERDITDPATRQAARRFLAEFTARLLTEVGAVKLLLDYEFFWFALPKTPEIREAYRAWFIEASGVCRDTARSLGKENLLQIGCCVNTDSFDTGKSLLGHEAGPGHVPQQWLLDIVAACDFFAIDSYAQTKASPTSPEAFHNVVKFWIEYYAGNKPVFVTENGFSSAAEQGFTEPGYHARGTEAEQADFFERVFAAFTQRNSPEFAFLKKVRGYGIWMYRDMPNPENLLEQCFGITRTDGSRKPAWHMIKAGIEAVENNSELTPVSLAVGEPATLAQIAAGELKLAYESGADHQAIEIVIQASPEAESVELVADLDQPACLIIRDEQGGWFSSFSLQKDSRGVEQRHSICLPVMPGRQFQRYVLYFTQEKFPCKVTLMSITANLLTTP